jgi:hypothetical protein
VCRASPCERMVNAGAWVGLFVVLLTAALVVLGLAVFAALFHLAGSL